MNLNHITCTDLKGVGKSIAEKLAKCHIYTLQDILFHLPFRYQDRTHVTPMADLRVGDYAVIEGIIKQQEIVGKKKVSLVLEVQDGTGSLHIRFFHFNKAQQKSLMINTRIRCFGEVRTGFYGLEMIHPEYQRLLASQPVLVEETLTPIYPSVAGLQQKSWKHLTTQVLVYLQTYPLIEYLPEEIIAKLKFPSLMEAIKFVHRPPPEASTQQLVAGLHPAQQRLAFEELLAHRLSLRKLRQKTQENVAVQLPIHDDDIIKKFLADVGFVLTGAQQRVIAEINQDLQKAQPMLRLLQGDVGSGKTVVAVLAALQAIEAGYQVALMAPTEILAEQHYRNLTQWLCKLNISVSLLAGKHQGKKRSAILEEIANGSAKMIVGTQALFQEKVHFHKLALIIVDEQHRFGVDQRLALRKKGSQDGFVPHQLIMTATPIPRTLAMTAYADLDVSSIDELPPGRTPISTIAMHSQKRAGIIQHVAESCRAKKQVYWVCPLIEESDILQCQAAEAVYQELCVALPEFKIGLVHGRMKSKEKEIIMQSFKDHTCDLLVATTVIEVGVDVPNASLMIIENAERLGLSQLHQLRGRVGRGHAQSYCVLLYQPPLSTQAHERIKIMRETTNGFLIAQKDLEIRGAGEVLGTRQTGGMNFKVADLQRDYALLDAVQQAASQMMQTYSHLVDPLIKRWIADGEKYCVV